MESDSVLIETQKQVTPEEIKSVKRREDLRMITGHALYTDDIKLKGCLYAAFLRSEHSHALIKAIKTENAMKLEGVVAVYTGSDLKDHIKPVPTAWLLPDSDLKLTPYHAVAFDKVRYSGDPVAVVVAVDPYIAYDALDLIEVEYEVLPSVTDQEKAVEDGSPMLYDSIKNNIAFNWHLKGGDPDKVFSEAEVVIKERFVNQRLQPAPMETRGVISEYSPSDDKYTVWMTSQNPHVHRFLISSMLGIQEQKLRVISPDVGGGFGSKISCYGIESVIAYISKDLEKPVKWQETRRENFLSSTHGRNHVQYVELAATKEGKILGIRAKVYANMGAWLSTTGPGVPTVLFGFMFSGQYDMKAMQCDVVGVLTNTVAVDAYRGAGRPEASYLVERMVDILAHKLNMDPVELRLKNYIKADSFPHPVVTGMLYDSGNYEAAMKKAVEIFGYNDLKEDVEIDRKRGILSGIGISSYIEMSGVGPSKGVRGTGFSLGLWESATVRVHPSGKVSAYTGGHPHGQGEETTFAQLVSGELGIDFDDVEIHHGDTEMIPFGMGTYGSRTTPVAGGALAVASRKIMKKATEIAAFMLGSKKDDITYKNGKFYVPPDTTRYKTFQEVAFAAYGAGATELPDGMSPGLDETVFYDPENFVFPFGVHMCHVIIDPETFKVKIKKYVSVDDCGTQINPMLVEGQVQGGVAQGIAQALYEESIYDDSGNLITSTFSDYGIPTAVEIPRIKSAFTYTPSPHNPIGAKGIGEAGTIAAPTAVVNAVVDALWSRGITSIDMPVTPEKIWNALRGVK